jgi:hypothetical protein
MPRRKRRSRARSEFLDQFGDQEALEVLWELRGVALSPTLQVDRDIAPERLEVAVRLAVAESAYHVERNPIHAWLAWAICRSTGEEIPEWVTTYFDRAAGAITHLAIRPPRAPEAALAIALEMKEPRRSANVFKRFSDLKPLLDTVNVSPFLDALDGKEAESQEALARAYAISAALSEDAGRMKAMTPKQRRAHIGAVAKDVEAGRRRPKARTRSVSTIRRAHLPYTRHS